MVIDKTTIFGVEYKTEKKNSTDIKYFVNGKEVSFYSVNVSIAKKKKEQTVISITIIQ